MNAKQKLHQSNLALWVSRFQDQKASGLSVKSWCLENNISMYAYNYWKHIAKEEYIDSILPDIVPVASSDTLVSIPQTTTSLPSLYSESRDSHNSNSIRISIDDIHIEIGPNASDELLTSIIKAVRHA